MKFLVVTCIVASVIFAQDFKLPAPFATPSASNQSRVIERPAGAELKVPTGFVVEEYMSGFERPRKMILGPGKELLIADSAPGTKGAVWIAQGGAAQSLCLKIVIG
jgi:glucose/arabinose dehydrogenase